MASLMKSCEGEQHLDKHIQWVIIYTIRRNNDQQDGLR